jgi:hypothetical protein
MRLALWMYQGTAHHGVGRIANSMRGVHAVFHAPQGDDYVNPIFTMLERTPDFPRMTTSVVSGRDLAQGTVRLPETLRAVDAQVHPDLIIVCASCSTILLQEDLERMARSAGTKRRGAGVRRQSVSHAGGAFRRWAADDAGAAFCAPAGAAADAVCQHSRSGIARLPQPQRPDLPAAHACDTRRADQRGGAARRIDPRSGAPAGSVGDDCAVP